MARQEIQFKWPEAAAPPLRPSRPLPRPSRQDRSCRCRRAGRQAAGANLFVDRARSRETAPSAGRAGSVCAGGRRLTTTAAGTSVSRWRPVGAADKMRCPVTPSRAPEVRLSVGGRRAPHIVRADYANLLWRFSLGIRFRAAPFGRPAFCLGDRRGEPIASTRQANRSETETKTASRRRNWPSRRANDVTSCESTSADSSPSASGGEGGSLSKLSVCRRLGAD